MRDESTERRRGADSTWAHVLLIGVASLTFELAFVTTNLNLVDEGWPLYAAMQIHAGGTLYDDVFFVFPPGHVGVAWIAYGIAPPGVLVSRLLYAAFDVALVFAIYFLGRRVMPPRHALFGALLLAVAAETAHHQQLLFGYRYLVIVVIALIAFARHLETRRAGYMLAAGALTGLALAFRLTPAFAAACGIGVGLVASSRSPRVWVRDGVLYAIGLSAVVAPVLGWLLTQVPADVLWREIVVRPVVMTDLQSLPVPEWRWIPEEPSRRAIHEWFVAVQFRTWTLLYVAYGIGVAVAWARDLRAGRAFSNPLLAAIVVFGATYFGRSFGRSDGPHLYSALPPICLLLAHAAGWVRGALARHGRRMPRRALLPLAAAALFGWIFLMGSDRIFWPGYLGRAPLESLSGRIGVRPDSGLLRIDRHMRTIARLSRPDERILDLSASSLFYVLSGRRGPGMADIIMPGTFLDETEERRFLARLEADPPAVVIYPGWIFDDRRDRAVQVSAPLVWEWVRARYERIGPYERFVLMAPKGRVERPEPAAAPDRGGDGAGLRPADPGREAAEAGGSARRSSDTQVSSGSGAPGGSGWRTKSPGSRT